MHVGMLLEDVLLILGSVAPLNYTYSPASASKPGTILGMLSVIEGYCVIGPK